MSSRIHRFEAIENVRDYGDYAGAGGLRLTRGRLLRSGHHAKATDADLQRLSDMGMAVVVDLRHPAERGYQPSRRLPGWDGLVIESDIDNDERGEPPHVTFLKTTDLSAESVATYMTDAYRRIPFEARHLDLFTRYFDALDQTDGAVLIHCAAGKDRTGLLAALTHRITGVWRSCTQRRVRSSVTNTSGRIRRNSPLREYVTGGSALSLPVNIAFLSRDSQKSSAVWPKATTLQSSSLAIS